MGTDTESDRWQQIEKLFYAALEVEPGRRSAFLDQACGGDAALRAEVESLLECSERPLDFLEETVQSAARQFLKDPETENLQFGARLGSYEVIRLLGSGGMGEVYLAEDVRLRRKVALKILKRELTLSEGGLQRFEREAQTASALNHPNIVTVYELGQAAGLHFIVTEFVEGRTLREELRGGRLAIGRALDIAIQIAGALEAAHSAGIVHRDIKPDNVMTRPDSLVKVLDFGIAKLAEKPTGPIAGIGGGTTEFETRPGTVLGTAKYMSPEQARGTGVDKRSDLFSLGAVIYEMVAGRAPFEGETQSDLIAEILKGDPVALIELAPETPPELERIIGKAMRKERADRYQTAKELLSDLQALKNDLEFQAKLQGAPRKRMRPRQPFASGTGKRVRELARKSVAWAALALVTAILGIVYYSVKSPKPAHELQPRSLAVLPFRNVKHDASTEFLGFSLADAVITKLGYLNALTVRPSSSVERYRNQAWEVKKAARELKVDMLLTGNFIKEGSDLRITAQLVDARADAMLWQDTINLNYEKLLTAQDRVAGEIIRGLELKLSPQEAERLKPDRPMNNLAYEYYLRGVDLYSLSSYAAAIEMLEKSAALEPNYGPTWASLGRAYSANASFHFGGREQYRRAHAAYERALALDPALTLPRIYMANLLSDTGRVEEAVPLLRATLENSPNNAEAHWELGYAYRFAGMLKESVEECERARQLDPEVKLNSSALNSYLYLGDYDKFLQSLPANDSAYILFYRGFGEYYRKNPEQARRNFDRAFDVTPTLLQAKIGKALSHAIAGETASGLELLQKTEHEIEERGVSDSEAIYKVAQGYAVLGDKSAALRMLKGSIEGGFFCYPYVAADPLLATLHGRREFAALLGQARQRHERFKARFF